MSAKTNTEVVIDGKVYTMSGYEGPDYLQRVAAYINSKIAELNEMTEYRHLASNMRATLIELNIADDYFKLKDKIEKQEREIEQKDKEIYDLKHDLISNQLKLENTESAVKKKEAENKELLLKNARLQASLDDIRHDNMKQK